MANLTNNLAEGRTPAEAKPILAARPLDHVGTHRDLAIVAVGYQPHKAEWIDHRFQMYAVGLVVSGRGRYQMAGGEVAMGAPPRPIEPGTMFTVFPGPVFTYGPATGMGSAAPSRAAAVAAAGGTGAGPTWEEYYFCALGSGVRRWIDCGWFPVDGTVYRLATPAVAVECYRELMRVQNRGARGDADRAVVLAERLLIEMFHGRATEHLARPSDEALQAVLNRLQQNFAGPVDFPALARDHAMSYSSLRQRLREATGLPPAQYLMHLRCRKAQGLLSDTDLSIHAIGVAVGIGDPFAFSRTFKKCVGLAPDLYRRQTAPWAGRRARRTASRVDSVAGRSGQPA